MKRHQELLRLIPEGTYVTTTQLAEALGVSSRTVRSDISQLNDELGEWGARVVSTPRRGVTLQVRDRQLYARYQPQPQSADLSQEERIQQVVEYLLTVDHPVLMDDLADMLFFSRSTLKRDMREVRGILGRYGLRIDNRAHQGMRVEGREQDIRSCLAHARRESGVAPATDEGEGLGAIREIVASQATAHSFRLSDLAVENLAVHLLIAVKRIRVGNCVELPAGAADELGGEAGSAAADVALAIVESVERLCGVSFPQGESYNFMARLISREIVSPGSDGANTVVSEEAYRLVLAMLDRVRESYQIDLRHDLELVTTLSIHLIPLRARMKYGMVSANPLLDDVRHNYVLAYSMATVACGVLVEEYGHEVPADEVAYVAMYLSIALSRRRDGMKDNVLIVCGSGKASSELLAYRVRDSFGKYLNVVGTTSAYGLSQVDFSGIDYLFTTVPITSAVPVPIIEVSALLGGDDVSRITQELSRSRTAGLMSDLVRPELVVWMGAEGKAEVLSELCSRMEAQGGLPDDFASLVMEREGVGTTAFGNLVAIAHPIRPVGEQDLLALAILDHPIDWGSEQVQLVFLLSVGKGQAKRLQTFYRMMNQLIGSRGNVDALARARSVGEVRETLLRVAEGSQPA